MSKHLEIFASYLVEDSMVKIDLRKHTRIALLYFLVIALLGVWLRLFFVFRMPDGFNFNNVLHAHSHTALLGWIFIGLMTLIYRVYIDETSENKSYRRIFLLTNISALGMLISFPIQGYAFYSISFSTLYLINSYIFTGFIVRNVPERFKYRPSFMMVRMGLFYLVFSSLGIWAVGPVIATVGSDSDWFKYALYFFLHFLYSGFFFSTLIGILLHILEENNIEIPAHRFSQFFVFLHFGIIFSYMLSVLWTGPNPVFYFIATTGAVMQIYGYYLFYKLIRPHLPYLKERLGSFGYGTMKLAWILLIIRIFMQLASALPYFAALAFKYRDFIIGYLHMVFLGIIIPVMLIFLHYYKLMHLSKKPFILFLFTVFITEILIFYRAIAYWLHLPLPELLFFNHLLAWISLLFPISVVWIIIQSKTFSSR